MTTQDVQTFEESLLALVSQCDDCGLLAECKVKSHAKNKVIIRCLDNLDFVSGQRSKEEILADQR